jgi:hypothetical protein
MEDRDIHSDELAIPVIITENDQLEINSELTVDLTDQVIVVNEFHVDDRVERLASETERSHWGTITSRIHVQGRDDWLVLDNDGVTHLDPGRDLAPARRGRFRRPIPDPGD